MRKILFFLFVFGIFNSVLWAVYQPTESDALNFNQAKKAFQDQPHNPDARFELAMSLSYVGQIELAWAVLKKIPEYDKNYAEKVIERYEKERESTPENWMVHYKLAFGYYFADQKDEAFESFQNVIDRNPNLVWTYGFQGVLLGEKKDYKQVIKICRKALTIEPDATAIHFLLGEAYYKVGDLWGVFTQALKVGQLKSDEKNKGVYDNYTLD